MSDEVQRHQRHNLIVTIADRSPKQEHDWRVWVLSLCSSEVYDQKFTITNYYLLLPINEKEKITTEKLVDFQWRKFWTSNCLLISQNSLGSELSDPN